MNFKSIAALVIAAAAGSAFAETPTIVKDEFNSIKSRAEVQAELGSYRQAGVNPWSIAYNPLVQFKGTASRADVTAAYIAERAAVAAITGEDSGSAYFFKAPAAVRSDKVAGQPAAGQ